MKAKTNLKKLASYLYEAGTLRKIARAHRQNLLTDDLSDNIASHTFRVTLIAYFLAKLEKVDSGKVMLMGLIHDSEESRCGDQNWVHKRYVKVFEEEIREGQFLGLPAEKELIAVGQEYQKRESKEAKIAKDADLLDQIMLIKEYAAMGNKEAESWLIGNQQEKLIKGKEAKKLAKEIMKQKPSDWWNELWCEKRR
jgi:putative hydrolases of HD superfamily